MRISDVREVNSKVAYGPSPLRVKRRSTFKKLPPLRRCMTPEPYPTRYFPCLISPAVADSPDDAPQLLVSLTARVPNCLLKKSTSVPDRLSPTVPFGRLLGEDDVVKMTRFTDDTVHRRHGSQTTRFTDDQKDGRADASAPNSNESRKIRRRYRRTRRRLEEAAERSRVA